MSATLSIHNVKRIVYVAPCPLSHDGVTPSFMLQRIMIENKSGELYWLDLYVDSTVPIEVENVDNFGEFFNAK